MLTKENNYFLLSNLFNETRENDDIRKNGC